MRVFWVMQAKSVLFFIIWKKKKTIINIYHVTIAIAINPVIIGSFQYGKDRLNNNQEICRLNCWYVRWNICIFFIRTGLHSLKIRKLCVFVLKCSLFNHILLFVFSIYFLYPSHFSFRHFLWLLRMYFFLNIFFPNYSI